MDNSRPIRVMRIIARLNVGGPAIHVTLLTARMRPPAFDSTLVCGHVGPHEGDMAYLAEACGVTPVYVPELGRELSPLRDLITLFKLWRLMRRLRPDVVHTHTAKAGFVGRVAAWLAGVPVRVHTFHGHVFHGYFGPRKTALFLTLERLTARLTDRLITISPALKEELASVYHIAPAEKIAVVPLGLDLSPYLSTSRHLGEFRRQHELPADAPLVGIVGRLVPIKNHALFLKAAQRVRQSYPNAHFVIIGDGELRESLVAQAKALGIADAVTFTGFLRDLRPVYSDLDLLVISSDNEGTPVSIIEALAAGVPVVSTAVGGVPDLLDGGRLGTLVPPGDPDALAGAMVRALRASPEEQSVLRQQVGEQFGIERLVNELGALYRELLESKRSRSP
ncbi:MAG: glycosyl transferase [Anaerolineae bacterium]|nr:MAG: glycosyl transferase [Anaerolineae bacterium]